MTSDLHTARLADLAELNPRRRVKKGETVPFIEMAAIPTNGRDIDPANMQWRVAKGSGSHFQDGDTLLARITPCLENGKTAQVRCLGDQVIGEGSTEFIVLCGRDPRDNDFVYYVCRDPTFRQFAIARMEGTSGRQRVAWQSIAEYLIDPPPSADRRASAALLAKLDDRIDNLRATSATLEAIAQALFKSWFVDFDPVHAKAEGRAPEGIDAATAALFPSEFEDSELGPVPKGWRVEKLGACCKNVKGKADPGQLDGDTPYIGLEHMPRGTIALGDWGTAEGLASAKFWYEEGDVLFGKLRPYFHKVGVANHRGICSTDILVIRANDPALAAFCLMHLSSKAMIQYATQISTGTRMPRANWKGIAGYQIVMPDNECIAAFNTVAQPLIAQIGQSINTIRTLAELRDTLLPRLISGKLRIPDARSLLESAVN